MTAAERKLVHTYLEAYAGVTHRRAKEPSRIATSWCRHCPVGPLPATADDRSGPRRLVAGRRRDSRPDRARSRDGPPSDCSPTRSGRRSCSQGWDGEIVDVGSGNGAPGIPLAHALPDRGFVLLEAERRKCEFLERWAPANARVLRGRVEEQGTDWAGVALAKALAPPPVAAEWCLPLVRPGRCGDPVGRRIGDLDRLARVAALLGAELADGPAGLAVLRKLAPTPPGFPRRTGVARKRPLDP